MKRIRNLKPEWVNMGFTLLGFLSSSLFYIFVLFKKPQEVKPVPETLNSKQFKQIELLFQNVLTKQQEEEKHLLKQMYEKERLLEAESKKLNMLRKKLRTRVDQSWEQLSEQEKSAYTEYAISQIEKQKK